MHPNAEFAFKLKTWVDDKVDEDDVVADGLKRGFLSSKDGVTSLTSKGEDFISKWTNGKPANTYERKPIETNHATSKPKSTHSSSRRSYSQDSSRGHFNDFNQRSQNYQSRPYQDRDRNSDFSRSDSSRPNTGRRY
jgi:hypothetical protein